MVRSRVKADDQEALKERDPAFSQISRSADGQLHLPQLQFCGGCFDITKIISSY